MNDSIDVVGPEWLARELGSSKHSCDILLEQDGSNCWEIGELVMQS